MRTTGGWQATVAPLITLSAAIGLCALVVLVAPGLADLVRGLIGEAGRSHYPAIETVGTLVLFGSLLLCALAGAAVSKVNPLELGRNFVRIGWIGAIAGLGGLSAAAAYAWLGGALEPGTGPPVGAGLLIWGTLLILFATTAEEIYFRGWVQPVLARSFGAAAGVLLSALAFAALHLIGGARSPVSLANLFLGGLLFGLLAARGGGIAGAAAAHFSWNWGERILLGVDPNPGVGSFGAIFDYDLVGPALWGGSDEGLNASVTMTMALAALVLPLLILLRFERSGPGDGLIRDRGSQPQSSTEPGRARASR
ncbi:MAG TPA: CPBP family intramembrane glutamic endopeptidase [Allosphingosinicella sp.]|jgi:hypothetical protein